MEILSGSTPLENSREILCKFRIDLSYDSAIPLWGILPQDKKHSFNMTLANNYSLQCLVKINTKIWNQSICSMTDECFMKVWYMYNGIL